MGAIMQADVRSSLRRAPNRRMAYGGFKTLVEF
jgi:hypothetical protein